MAKQKVALRVVRLRILLDAEDRRPQILTKTCRTYLTAKLGCIAWIPSLDLILITWWSYHSFPKLRVLPDTIDIRGESTKKIDASPYFGSYDEILPLHKIITSESSPH